MVIETFSRYNPKATLPVYTHITDPRQNDYKRGETYEIRVEDQEEGDEGPFNYTHEAVLVGKYKTEFGELDPVLLAFDSNARSKSEAVERISIGSNKWDDDREVVVLTFVRVDKAKEFVSESPETIPGEFDKADFSQ